MRPLDAAEIDAVLRDIVQLAIGGRATLRAIAPDAFRNLPSLAHEGYRAGHEAAKGVARVSGLRKAPGKRRKAAQATRGK